MSRIKQLKFKPVTIIHGVVNNYYLAFTHASLVHVQTLSLSQTLDGKYQETNL